MQIQGRNGNVAEVEVDGSVKVLAVSQNLPEALNIANRVYVVNGSVTPVGANDYFLYIKNDGLQDIAVSTISLTSSVSTRIEIHNVIGTPTYTAPNDADVVSLNLGNTGTLTGEFVVDTNITDIISDGLLIYENCNQPGERYQRDIPSSIIIPQGKSVAFLRVESTGTIDFNVGIGVVS